MSTSPYWANEPCPPWFDQDHPSSRHHMSTDWMCFVVLSTEDPDQADGLPPVAKELEIYLQQHFREIGPRITISQRPTGEPRFHLIPTEARHLGEGLIRLATMASDPSKLHRCEPCEHHPT